MKNGVRLVRDRVPAFREGIRTLLSQDVLVGVPGETNFKGRKAGEPSNAALAYIHDQGAPESNIPARPFMAPGIADARPKIVDRLKSAGVAALDGNSVGVTSQLHAAGLAAVASIRAVIRAGIAPPLAASTVKRRISRRKSASWKSAKRAAVAANVAAGNAPGEGLFTPLIDTGALLSSITHVLRKRGR
jgi:hypothetical protein